MANDTFLRIALRGNAAFSTLSGVAALAFAGALAPWLGVPDAAPWLRALGVGLLGFAACLVWLASRAEIPPVTAWGVVMADLAWVAGTVPLVAIELLSRPGDWLAVGIADFVLLFAVLQAVGIRRLDGPRRVTADAT
jgi:hypothetical protein